jgi:hypothetical protein
MSNTTVKEDRALAEELLKTIAYGRKAFEEVEREARLEMERVKALYEERIRKRQKFLKTHEDSLVALMKRRQVFDGADKVTLASGVLLWLRAPKVSIPRDALQKMDALGWTDGIKVVRSIDRDALDKWPDTMLAQIGAERKEKEVFSYETNTKD